MKTMKNGSRGSTALLFAALLGLAPIGCGRGDEVGVQNGTTTSQPATVSVKTGSIATDSWGYTGSAPTAVSAPDTTAILLPEHTLLVDSTQTVVSGVVPSRVSFSSDPTTLAAAAKASAPPGFLCYLDISLGSASTSIPAFSVGLDTGASPGETVNLYYYDAPSGLWVASQTALVGSSGTISFPASRFSLWGIFR